MPTYDYECKKCNEIFEEFQSIMAEKLTTCPKCGSPIKRLVGTGSGIVFKGSGFYETDFKNKKSSASATKTSSNTSETKTSTGNKTQSSENLTANKTTEKKQAS